MKTATATGPYLNATDAAHYSRIGVTAQDPGDAFRRWARRHGVIPIRRGIYLRSDIDRAMRETVVEPRLRASA